MIEAFYSRMYTILQRESGTTGLFEINFTFNFNWRFDREITSPLSTIISFDHMFSHIAREDFYQNNLKSLIKHGQAYLIRYSDNRLDKRTRNPDLSISIQIAWIVEEG
jgi:hypothetical protein